MFLLCQYFSKYPYDSLQSIFLLPQPFTTPYPAPHHAKNRPYNLCSITYAILPVFIFILFKSNIRETWRVILVSKADIFLSESLRILAERLSQLETQLPLRQICYYSLPEEAGVFSTEIKSPNSFLQRQKQPALSSNPRNTQLRSGQEYHAPRHRKNGCHLHILPVEVTA